MNVIRSVVVALACTLGASVVAEPFGFRPVQDWPLGACKGHKLGARLCLDAPQIWARFGHGAPEVEVAVVETWETETIGQVLDQHPWLSHLDIPIYWHAQDDAKLPRVFLRLLPGARNIKAVQPSLVQFCKKQTDNPACAALEEVDSARVEAALGYLSWAEQSSAHELKMIDLITGQDAATMRRTGLAPLTSVSLHYIETTPNADGLHRLADRLNRSSGLRVVNYSNEGPPYEMLDLQFARIYRTALAVNAGRGGQTGADPGDRLVVASSANTTGYHVIQRVMSRPHRFVPPEATVVLDASTQEIRQSHARIALALPQPDVPLLIVGGITQDGQLFGQTRLEPMIDLYAPGGMTFDQATQAHGLSSTTQRALTAYKTILAMQACRGIEADVQALGVPTLGWGARDNVRSSRLALQANATWDTVGPIGGAPTLGCETGEVAEGIFLSRDIGNSVSTAIVSAVAAQMFHLDPQISARDARDILRRTAQANRVHGLPVLNAEAALQEVVERFAQRYLDELPERYAAQDATGRIPIVTSSANVPREAGQFTLAPTSLETRSIAPGAFGQSVWRDLHEDPPLQFSFEAEFTPPRGACRRYRVALETDVRQIRNFSSRVVRSEAITALRGLCARQISERTSQ